MHRRLGLALFLAALATHCDGPKPPEDGNGGTDTPAPNDSQNDTASDTPSDRALDQQAPDVTIDSGMDATIDVRPDVVSTDTQPMPDTNTAETSPDASSPDASDGAMPGTGPFWCSVGTNVAGVTVPAGFCIREYATVRSARTLAVAPNGDLFVGAPSIFLPGGANGGPGALVVLSDDNRDGVAESTTFLRAADIHGIAIGGGFIYYTTTSTIFRTPYTPGQRTETAGARVDLRLPEQYARGRPTHGLALSRSGTIYTSGGMVGSGCGTPSMGAIFSAGMESLENVAWGFRNPMYLRCHPSIDACAATELGEDQTPGAREKFLRIRPMSDYGYGCGCFTRNAPMSPNCTMITEEDMSISLGDTPFGFDWERGTWPEPYRNGVFIAMHGSFYTSPPWQGAGVRWAPVHATTGVPTQNPVNFLEGAGPGGSAMDRPSDIAFSHDGRMFIADDNGSRVFWVAPETARMY